jgi:hypothetical protein
MVADRRYSRERSRGDAQRRRRGGLKPGVKRQQNSGTPIALLTNGTVRDARVHKRFEDKRALEGRRKR